MILAENQANIIPLRGE